MAFRAGEGAALVETLEALVELRRSLRNPHPFDDHCQIRFHRHTDPFSYYRFDDHITTLHPLNPSSDTVLKYHHWKHEEGGRGPELAKIFKNRWEEASIVVCADSQQFLGKTCRTLESMLEEARSLSSSS